MNEAPKSVWRRPWRGWTGILAWIVLLTGAVFVTVCCISLLVEKNTPFLEMIAPALVISVSVAAVVIVSALFLHWLFSWQNIRRFLIGIACFVTLLALAYVEENVRGKYAWNKFKREWEAKGERLDLASLVPPPVPDEQNFALTPIVASSYAQFLDKNGHELQPRNTNVINRLMMDCDRDLHGGPTNKFGKWQRSKPTDLKGWQEKYRALPAKTDEFPVAPQPQSPAADVLLALSRYDSAIEELRQASRLPASRFPLTYDNENPATVLLPHLDALRSCAKVLQLRAIAQLQNGQNDRALEDIELSLHLADAIRTEPYLISHLVRVAILNLMLQPTWEGLAEQRWTDAQLADLDRALEKQDFLAAYVLAMRGEMAVQCGIFDYLRRRSRGFDDLGINGDSAINFPTASALGLLKPQGWFYQNQLRCARMMAQHFLPAVDAKQRIVQPPLIRHADKALEIELKHRTPFNYLEHMLMPALGPCVRKLVNAQSSVDLARVACVLERYRLAHGEYPASLDVLAPQFIAKLPHDVIGGQPLKYRRTDDGQFVLYSVGWNETDDGGKVVLNKGSSGTVNLAEGDWVWRYPAK